MVELALGFLPKTNRQRDRERERETLAYTSLAEPEFIVTK